MLAETASRLSRPIALAALLLASTALEAHAANPEPPSDLAIEHVHVVDVLEGRVLADQTVLIHEGTIRGVGPTVAGEKPKAAATLDAEGAYLIPGLWDMHAHLRSDGLPASLTTEWLMPLILANGVTGLRDMNSDCDGPDRGPVCLDQMLEWQSSIEAGELLGPRLLALSSVPVNPPWDYEVSEEEARAFVAAFDERGVDLIKSYFRLSPEAFAWFADEATRRGIEIGGHLPLGMTAREASDAGLRTLEHARDFLFDCFPGSADFRRDARSQNPPIETLRAMVKDHDDTLCRTTFAAFVRNDTWYVPTHVTRRMDAYADDPDFRNDPRSRYLPQAMWQGWARDADRMVQLDPSPEGRSAMRAFYEKGLEITGAAHRAGVSIALGTDAGDTYSFPGSGVHDELGELVKAGLSNAEALRAATWKGAELLGLTDQYGSVEAGKRADLVLLERNPLESIDHVRGLRAVIFRGELLDRERLDELLAGAEAAARSLQLP